MYRRRIIQDHRGPHRHALLPGCWVRASRLLQAHATQLTSPPAVPTRSSAVIALGAATLADIYEPAQRGTMMGIYYSAPLLGPSLGPILGGALTQAFSWRATFWFLAAFVCACFLSFLPFLLPSSTLRLRKRNS